MPVPMTLTNERRERVEHLLTRAAAALIDAQIEMLMDTPHMFEHELSMRLSPPLYTLYKATEAAEAAVVKAQMLVTPTV